MFPILFQTSFFTLHTYGLFAALGLWVGLQILISLYRQSPEYQFQFEENLQSLFLYVIVSGILGARILYVITFWNSFSEEWIEIFKIWNGGLVFYGGFIGGFLGFYIGYRKNNQISFLKILDWSAPALAWGHAIGRLGCFAAGCCYGKPTEKFLGLIFTHAKTLAPIGLSVHPTQLYEFVFLVILGKFLIKKTKRKKYQFYPDGFIFLDYLTFYSCGRFLIEFFRADDPIFLFLTPGQFMSGIVFISALFCRFYWMRAQAKK